MTVKSHYDNHLARVYNWMSGNFSDKVNDQIQFFRIHAVIPGGNRIAYDLGAGHGIQAVALARLGFHVTAVDFNRDLLGELGKNADSLPVNAIEEDIVRFLEETSKQAELITCMGDTLTHLQPGQVETLIREISKKLSDGGKVILSYRDLSVDVLGTARFVHVKSDDTRTMSCFLEYFPEHVMVHDIIVEKEDETWKQLVSCYPKLRIPAATVRDLFKLNHIDIIHQEEIRGMVFLIGQRASSSKTQ